MTTLTQPHPVAAAVGPDPLTLRVTATETAAPGIRSLELRGSDGSPLPPYPPGSHIVLTCGDRANAYSLTGPGTSPGVYHVSVLRVAGGRGGSAWIHDSAAVGDVITTSRPRSGFAPVTTARHHLLVAGGIGITPMLSHVRAAVAWGRSFTLIYGHRPGVAPHLDELRLLCGERLTEVDDGADAMLGAVDRALTVQPLGTHLYVCGPTSLMDHVTVAARTAGWPDERVHTERFTAAAPVTGGSFTVRLARSNRSVEVPADATLLDALTDAGVTVPSMCRQGVCGECRTGLLSGTPDHRDFYLSTAEREARDSIMCCVSRGHDELELDL